MTLEREKLASEMTKLDEFTLRFGQSILQSSASPEDCAVKARKYAIAHLKELYGKNA